MVKQTQTIRWQYLTNCLSVFDHFVRLALKGMIHVILSQKVLEKKTFPHLNNQHYMGHHPLYGVCHIANFSNFHGFCGYQGRSNLTTILSNRTGY